MLKFAEQKQKELNGKAYRPLLERISKIPKYAREFALGDAINIRANLCSKERDEAFRLAMDLRSWRKGPFGIDDIFIDSEWKSFVKYNLLEPHLNLEGKTVGDIGCNNGYYMFRMLKQKPKRLIGFDPGVISYLQFEFIDRFIDSSIRYELLGVEHLPEYGEKFDTLFCLGVLYHRSDPIKTLKELKGALNSGGELFLDTMYIEGGEDLVLSPKNAYSKIPNIYFVPTVSALMNWCERANFKDVEILATKPTDSDEQRKTEWILGQSLGDFLDPADPGLTIEGYPAPRRIYVRLSI
nr:tRNA 5-methoxyuridine(34)/uridine 5-oxyacetic acid(34) synthase CmoB [uncultured Campylobacter sp.]